MQFAPVVFICHGGSVEPDVTDRAINQSTGVVPGYELRNSCGQRTNRDNGPQLRVARNGRHGHDPVTGWVSLPAGEAVGDHGIVEPR